MKGNSALETEVGFEDLYEGWQDDPEFLAGFAAEVFADEICHAMEEQGVTQSELARRLGVSRQHISAFMADPGNPTLQTMVQMAHALGLRLRVTLEPAPTPVETEKSAQAEAPVAGP